MKPKLQKTNAARLLDKAGVKYELLAYDYDPEDLNACHTAECLGVEPGRVFKTLVLEGEKTGYFVCVIPADKEVDLKKAAVAASDKKAAMIPMKNLLSLTGYIRGGCTAVGMKKPFRVFFDQSALNYEEFYVSAGARGLQLKVSPTEFFAVVNGEAKDLTC